MTPGEYLADELAAAVERMLAHPDFAALSVLERERLRLVLLRHQRDQIRILEQQWSQRVGTRPGLDRG